VQRASRGLAKTSGLVSVYRLSDMVAEQLLRSRAHLVVMTSQFQRREAGWLAWVSDGKPTNQPRAGEGDNCQKGAMRGTAGVHFCQLRNRGSGVVAWLAAARCADFFSSPATRADVKPIRRCGSQKSRTQAAFEKKSTRRGDGWHGLRVEALPMPNTARHTVLPSVGMYGGSRFQAPVEKKEMARRFRWKGPRHSTDGRKRTDVHPSCFGRECCWPRRRAGRLGVQLTTAMATTTAPRYVSKLQRAPFYRFA
jgi:hypothetical protein